MKSAHAGVPLFKTNPDVILYNGDRINVSVSIPIWGFNQQTGTYPITPR
jgi:hypothetical protein